MPIVPPGTDLVTAATAYANAGLYIAPTSREGASPGKNPGTLLGKDWPSRSVTGGADAYEIFAEKFAGRAVGIALHCGRSGLIVVDIDTEDQSLVPPEIRRAIGEFNPPRQTTRAGAVLRAHYLFRQPPGRRIGNSLGRLGKGWGDLRGTNGVIILPGSWHPADNGDYRQQQAGPIPELPAYVAELVPDGADAESAVTDEEAAAFVASTAAGGAGMKPAAAKGPLKRFAEQVAAGGGRHEEAVAAAAWICREARAGAYPAGPALDQLRQAFLARIAADPGSRRPGSAEREFAGIVAWAVAQAVNESPERLTSVRDRLATPPPPQPLPDPGLTLPPTPAPLDGQPEETGPTLTIEGIKSELNAMLEGDRPARMREITPALAGLTVAQRQEWRSLFKQWGMTFGQFDELIKVGELERRRQQLAELQARRNREGWIELAPPHNPMTVARDLLALTPSTPTDDLSESVWHIGHWRGEFYQWTGTHWESTDDADVRHWVYEKTEKAYYVDRTGDEPKEPDWLPNTRKVNAVVDALGTGVLHRNRDDEHEPCIALANYVYDLASGQPLPHHPRRWNLTALPFDYTPGATAPQWLAFLGQVLPDDSITFLQEWIGYLVSGRTDQQKIASLIGLPRSGKGTINRVIAALLGKHAVAGPTLGSLIGPFGLEPLLGKSLATFADVKWSARGVGDSTELLKTISGEDGVTVHRKNKVSWEGRLPTRFMLMSNDTPSFTDASGALGNRLIHIRFTRSFIDNPDIGLTDRLLTELPGIFLWALDGLRRLDARGRFHAPADSAAVDEDVRRTASPHMVFLAEECLLDVADQLVRPRVRLDELWTAWDAWCRADGTESGSKRWLTRKIKAVAPLIDTAEEKASDGTRIKWLIGVKLARDPVRNMLTFTIPAPAGQG